MKLATAVFLVWSLISCKSTQDGSESLAESPAPKQEPKLILDANFEQEWSDSILPFMEKAPKSYFTATGGAQLESISIDNSSAKANIIAVHGFGQDYRAFSELLYNFWNNGYAVHSYSHVGHGCSDHLLFSAEENKSMRANQCEGLSIKRNGKSYYKDPRYCKVHVDDRERYIKDLKVFVDRVKTPGRKTYLYCHSMGGGICSRFLQEYPDGVDAAFMNSPMHQAKSEPFPTQVAKIILEGAAALKPNDYVPTNKEVPIEDLTFEKADHTSRARYDAGRKISGLESGRYRCGSTNAQGRQLLKLSAETTELANLDAVKVPVAIAAGGKDLDKWVELNAIEKFCKRVFSCRYYVHENSRHEIYNEPDSIRLRLMKDALAFYENPQAFIDSRSRRY